MKIKELFEVKDRPAFEKAVAALVRDDDQDALSDDEIRELGKKFKLTSAEIEKLVIIGQDAIGY